uniref:Uncharacterized protein n=1 Tax=Anguilla anguilla TaxID=7936 RepID=A0A0E9TT26_ANGAN
MRSLTTAVGKYCISLLKTLSQEYSDITVLQ